jgi:hypothetical protein
MKTYQELISFIRSTFHEPEAFNKKCENDM